MQNDPFRKWVAPSVQITVPPSTASSQAWEEWLSEDVGYLITNQELIDFFQLDSDREREKFAEDFWKRRNPNPGSPENKFREEHYRRIAYANKHYAGDIPGWKTDRGYTYVVYGPPDGLTGTFRIQALTEVWMPLAQSHMTRRSGTIDT